MTKSAAGAARYTRRWRPSQPDEVRCLTCKSHEAVSIESGLTPPPPNGTDGTPRARSGRLVLVARVEYKVVRVTYTPSSSHLPVHPSLITAMSFVLRARAARSVALVRAISHSLVEECIADPRNPSDQLCPRFDTSKPMPTSRSPRLRSQSRVRRRSVEILMKRVGGQGALGRRAGLECRT